MAIKVANFVATTIADAGGISAIATSMTVASASGMPSLSTGEWFRLVLVRASDGAVECIKVTARSSTTLTIVRGEEGTTALALASGDAVQMWVTAQTLTDLAALPTASIGSPTGSSLAKTVDVQTSVAGYHKLRAWLVDSSTPTEELTLVPPSGSSIVSFDVVTDADGLYTFDFDNSAAASATWYLCVELAGKVYISEAITMGT